LRWRSRAPVGEYGSVIFIAGQSAECFGDRAALDRDPALGIPLWPMPPRSSVVMLVASFLIIFAVNRIQRWAQTRIPAH